MATRSRRSRSASRTSRRRSSASHEQIAITAARTALDEFATGTGATGLRSIIKESITEALERLGIDTKSPDDTRRDMVHLRTWRELTENMKSQGLGEATKWFVRAALAALMVGVGVTIAKYGGGAG